uniref:hypothetical protein n=1 Tax=Candidatus Pantoea varia TaxID=1881036 RepID=UPI0011141479|nr:hypothetical protein [Pantoea varia]
MRHNVVAVRTWYQASEDMNEYGEETISIKGVYATEVGDDMPILTRLIQWKIVQKRDVDLTRPRPLRGLSITVRSQQALKPLSISQSPLLAPIEEGLLSD